MPMTSPGECSAHRINDVPEIAPKSASRFQDTVIGREASVSIRVFNVACAVVNGSNPAKPDCTLGVSGAVSAVIGPIDAVSIVSNVPAVPAAITGLSIGRIIGMGTA